MLLRPVLALACLSITIGCFSLGCAAPAADAGNDDEVETSAHALTPGALREKTALERLRVLGAGERAIQVDYAPAPTYAGPAAEVAFEAVHFDASGDAADVRVAGEFPSSATVLVTDEEFRVLAAAQTSANASGLEEASVRVPAGSGGRLVLVRDPKWVKPMVFELRIDR